MVPHGKCDIPLSLLKGTLEFIKNNIEVDAIFTLAMVQLTIYGLNHDVITLI